MNFLVGHLSPFAGNNQKKTLGPWMASKTRYKYTRLKTDFWDNNIVAGSLFIPVARRPYI